MPAEEVVSGTACILEADVCRERYSAKKGSRFRCGEEFEIVDFYLFLQNSRYAQKITYEIRYGSEEVKDDLVPKLLIEPLVENAVSHGLEPKETDGRILVEVRELGERLLIVVEDDGVGFDEEEAARTLKGCKGGDGRHLPHAYGACQYGAFAAYIVQGCL